MKLVDCFTVIFAYVSYLPELFGDDIPFDRVRDELTDLLLRAEEESRQSSFPAEDYDYARFAALAWVDEKILGMEFEGVDEWRRSPLQKVYYNTTRAGIEFFDRLEVLTPAQSEIREVFVLCLLLGFTGRYNQEKDRLYLKYLKTNQIHALSGGVFNFEEIMKGSLFPGAYQLQEEVKKKGGGRTLLRRLVSNDFFWLCSAGLFLCGGYWLYCFFKLEEMLPPIFN